MKKILALILVLIMCVGALASCTFFGGNDEAVTLDQAKDYLFNIMKDKNGKALPNDYDVVGKIIIEGTSFDVTWAVDKDIIKIKESSKANCWTVDLPDVNDTEFTYTLTATIKAENGDTAEVSFTPKMPVVDKTGVETELKEGVAYKMFFEQMNLGYTLYALNTTQDNKQKYINTTLDPKEAADFYVEIVDGGYKFYTDIDGVKYYVNATAVGEKQDDGKIKYTKSIGFATETEAVFSYNERGVYTVQISGETFGVGTYNAFETISISEFSYFGAEKINVAGGQFPITFMTSEYAETLEPDEKPVANDPAADSTLTIAQAIELGNTKVKDQYTANKYYVTGKITEVQNDNYGNLVISDGTNSILVYGTFDATGAKKYGEMDNKPVVGDTITVYGIVGMYNAPQLKNAWITSVTAGEGSGTVTPEPEKVYAVVDAPVAGTAYKFGMVQGNLNKTYYLAGGMDGYYMASTTNTNSAIDVYLEATTGGYYLYCMVNGTKTYINMVISGTHVNGAYEATASTVYTFDAENKTIVANVQPEGSEAAEPYWFGTRSDKTYSTVGPCAVSYAGFFCQFYAETDDVVTPPVGGEGEGEGEDTTDAVTSITDALTAEVGTKVVLTGNVISADTWSTQYNNMTVTIKDETGATILVYRMGTKVGLGDKITVTGEIGVHNNANQVAQGSTATILVVHGDNHTFENGTCTVCGILKPVEGQVTLSFGDVANRTAFDTSKQVWEQNGIKVTNDKGSSNSNVADYSNPARFYKGSDLTIAYAGMTKIIFECNSESYANALSSALANVTGATATQSGARVEVTLSAAADTFSFTCSGGQVRLNSLIVIAG